jgi:hypothetical protein
MNCLDCHLADQHRPAIEHHDLQGGIDMIGLRRTVVLFNVGCGRL